MARIKRSVHAKKKRREVLSSAKGYTGSRRVRYRAAKEQVHHSGVYAYRDRRDRKGQFRRLWIVRIDLGSELDLFQAGPRLLPAGLFLLDVALVPVLAVIHDPAHGWIGLRRDLDQIQIERSGLVQRVAGIDDADLLSIRSDQPDLWRPDPIVDPRIC